MKNKIMISILLAGLMGSVTQRSEAFPHLWLAGASGFLGAAASIKYLWNRTLPQKMPQSVGEHIDNVHKDATVTNGLYSLAAGYGAGLGQWGLTAAGTYLTSNCDISSLSNNPTSSSILISAVVGGAALYGSTYLAKWIRDSWPTNKTWKNIGLATAAIAALVVPFWLDNKMHSAAAAATLIKATTAARVLTTPVAVVPATK